MTDIHELIRVIREHKHTEEERLFIVGLIYCIANFTLVFTKNTGVMALCVAFMLAILIALAKFIYVAYIKKEENAGDSNR